MVTNLTYPCTMIYYSFYLFRTSAGRTGVVHNALYGQLVQVLSLAELGLMLHPHAGIKELQAFYTTTIIEEGAGNPSQA